MTDREVMRQALALLADAQRHHYALKHNETDAFVAALRARLAEPEPEPAAQDKGMTLRDYFAAKALAGYWAHYGADFSPDEADATARHCYQMADAMLEAREAK